MHCIWFFSKKAITVRIFIEVVFLSIWSKSKRWERLRNVQCHIRNARSNKWAISRKTKRGGEKEEEIRFIIGWIGIIREECGKKEGDEQKIKIEYIILIWSGHKIIKAHI